MKEFSFNTIEDFDEHILTSIPNYDILIEAIKSMSEYFMTEGSNIYDLGCSTGKLLKSIKREGVNKIGYDVANLLPEEDGFF